MAQTKRNRAGRFFAQLAVFVLAISIIILYILCLTGSTYTNPHVPQIFVAQIQKSSTLIEIGFYGICSDASAPNTTCSTTINRSADTIATTIFPNQGQAASTNTISFINFALNLQQRILLSPLPIAAGLFLLSLFLITLTLMIAKRQRHLIPSRRLRYLKIFTLDLVWLSTALAFTAALLVTEMVNGFQYIVSIVADGNTSVTPGGLLQVLLWVLTGLSAVFSAVTIGLLRDGRGGSGTEGGIRVDFEKGWKPFEDDHIIVF